MIFWAIPRWLLLAALLSGCAATTTRQCSIGITFFGPIPVPMAGCELIFEPSDEEDPDV